MIEKENIVKSVGIEFSDGKVIKSLQEDESYTYLGILEAGRFLGEKMKLKVSKEYFRRLKKVFNSKLNDGNLVQGVITLAVFLLRYSAAFISMKKWEIIWGKCDIGRLYIPRKDGGRGLIAIEDCADLEVRGLGVYVHGSEERLIQAARRDKVDGIEAASVMKKAKKGKRLQDWKEKAFHGQYLRKTKEVRGE